MTMITPSYLGETIEYSSLHACRSTLEDPTGNSIQGCPDGKVCSTLNSRASRLQYPGDVATAEGREGVGG